MKWKLDFVLHSGNKITGIFDSRTERTIEEMIETLLEVNPDSFIEMYGYYGFGKEIVMVKKSEVAAITVSAYEEGI